MKKIILSLIIGILVVSYASSTQHVDYSNPNDLGSEDIVVGINNENINPNDLNPSKLDEVLLTDPSLWSKQNVKDAVDKKLDDDATFISENNLDSWFNIKGGFFSVTGTSLTDYDKATGAVILRETGIKISGMDTNRFAGARIENGRIIFPDGAEIENEGEVSDDQMNYVVVSVNQNNDIVVNRGAFSIDGVKYTATGPMEVSYRNGNVLLESGEIIADDGTKQYSIITGRKDDILVEQFIGSIEVGDGYRIIDKSTGYTAYTADGQSLATIIAEENTRFVPNGGARIICQDSCILVDGTVFEVLPSTRAIISVSKEDLMNGLKVSPQIEDGRVVLFTTDGRFKVEEYLVNLEGQMIRMDISAWYKDSDGNFRILIHNGNDLEFWEGIPPLDPSLNPISNLENLGIGQAFVAAAEQPQETQHIVVGGESLSQIAQFYREQGYSVTPEQLIEANKRKYPRLEYDPDYIEIGWTLDIPGAPVIDDALELAKTNLPGTVDLTGATANTFNVRSGPGTQYNRKDLIELATYSIGGVYRNNKDEVWAFLPEQDGWIYIEGVIERGKLDCGEDCVFDFDTVPDSALPAVVISEPIPKIEGAARDAELIPAAFVSPVAPPSGSANTMFVNLVTQASITSNYGPRTHPITHRKDVHNGIDYRLEEGSPVWSPIINGRVVFAGYNGLSGNTVIVEHTLPDGMVERSISAHLGEVFVKKGDILRNQNTPIGSVGNTGRSTAPHLHQGCTRNGLNVDPRTCSFYSLQ